MTDREPPIDRVAHELESSVASFVRDGRLPGAAVGVVLGDELAWSFGYGFADVDAARPAGPSDLYRIASITKTFTATAIMQLRDDGKLDLDDPAVAHLPELTGAINPFGRIEAVTLRRLLSHESGLMGDPPGTEWVTRTYETSVEAVLASAPEITTAVPPNTQTKYSNLAFQLLGEVVTRRSGVPYAAYVRANVLEPLGMDSTAFDPPPDELARRCTTGYAARTFSDRLSPALPMNPAKQPVAEGGLWSSVEDLSRWVSAQFRTDADERGGDRILVGSTLREMHRPRYLGDDAWTEAFGIGWYAKRRDEEIWIQHAGGLPGFITTACFHAKDPVGAVVLLNGIGKASELAMTLAKIALDATRDEVEPATIPEPAPAAFADLLGVFADPGLYTADGVGTMLRVEWRDGQLTVIDPGNPAWLPTLTPSDDPLIFKVDPGLRESGERATFERSDEGRIRALTLGNATYVRLEPVEWTGRA